MILASYCTRTSCVSLFAATLYELSNPSKEFSFFYLTRVMVCCFLSASQGVHWRLSWNKHQRRGGSWNASCPDWQCACCTKSGYKIVEYAETGFLEKSARYTSTWLYRGSLISWKMQTRVLCWPCLTIYCPDPRTNMSWFNLDSEANPISVDTRGGTFSVPLSKGLGWFDNFMSNLLLEACPGLSR